MRNVMLSIICCFLLAVGAASHAQVKQVPLSADDTDKIREAANNPPERIKLYIKFINERMTNIKATLADKRAVLPDQQIQLHNLLDEFTRLVDELQDNLDAYADHHDDIRKPLKDVLDADARWQETLKLVPPSPSYDFVLKTALEAATSTEESSKKLLEEQNECFKNAKKSPKD